MSSAPPSSSRSSHIDVRTLSVTQLQKLADAGSRRARAELEGRMHASTSAAAAQQRGAERAPPPAARAPSAIDRVGAHALGKATPTSRRPPANPPVLTERAELGPLAAPAPTPAPAPASGRAALPLAASGAATARPMDEALQERLALIAQTESSSSRASGPPRLLGMVLIAWGAMLGLGGLIALGHGGGFYYLFIGLGLCGVGGLLMRCDRRAMLAHGLLLLVALGWAWRSGGGQPSLGLALVQAAPVWIAALWMTIRPVRDGLE